MKKIPGTLYHLGLTSAKDGNLNLNIWYKNQLVFEKSSIREEHLINAMQMFCETKKGKKFEIYSLGSANKFMTYSNF